MCSVRPAHPVGAPRVRPVRGIQCIRPTAPPGPTPAGPSGGLDPLRPPAQPHLHARTRERLPRRLADRLAEGTLVKADVARTRAPQQRRSGTRTRRARAMPAPPAGSGSAARSGPTAPPPPPHPGRARPSHSPKVWRSSASSPGSSRPSASAARGRAADARRASDGGSAERPGQMQRCGQPAAAQHDRLAPRAQHRDLQALLHAHDAALPSRASRPDRRCSSAETRAGRCRSACPSRSNEYAAPPSLRRTSTSVTRAPACAQSSAAAIPARPPPITITSRRARA